MTLYRLVTFVCTVLLIAQVALAQSPLKAVVEVEEDVYRPEDPANGSGPFWCFGSSSIVRVGDDVFVSGMQKIPDAKPLNNTRWTLFARSTEGWQMVQKDEKGRTREPCPLGAFPDDNVFLSVNPTLTPADKYSGPAEPQILRFSARRPSEPYEVTLPTWDGKPAFTEHSYRSFAVDGPRREMMLLQNIGYTHAEWAFRNSTGQWSARGKLAWPWGGDYAKPQAIRVCYPSVQLRDGAAYFCGVSDITEPNEAWRQYKRELTKQEWDYDFRRLFFTWSPDIATGKFRPWIEVASREKTGGHIFPCDLYADGAGIVHILWTEQALDTRLRKKFFPDARQSDALNYATINDGVVTSRRSLVLGQEDDPLAPVPGRGRFHVTPDGRLFILYYVTVKDTAGKRSSENRLVEVQSGDLDWSITRVPLKRPLSTFFTAGVRAGCAPSDTIDILGETGGMVRYARIRLSQ